MSDELGGSGELGGSAGPEEYMSLLGLECVDLIEAYHTKYGYYPERHIVEALLTNAQWDYTLEQLDEILDSPLLIRSLEFRGIVHPSFERNSTTLLTREQQAVIAALNNSRDNRSDVKKLSDLGVSARQFSGWMHSKRFTEHMRDSAENVLANSIADGHNALIRGVRKGDTNAIKLFFELTGRYNPAFENQVNLQDFMIKVIEAIQKHVRDPLVLQALAGELQMISVAHDVNPGSLGKKKEVRSLAPTRRETPF